jgi:asparagine synthase (glutamine-hydrolysing)
MECAISVARTLGFEHHSSTVPFEQYPLCANKLLKWEHLANGFNGIMGWVSHSHLSPLAPRVIVGYILDVVVGPKAFSSFHPKNVSFAKNFPGFNKWALQPQLLHKLLRKEIFGNLVEDTLTEIQKVYESYSEIELQRPFYFHLYHRSRYQLGSQLWRMSFGAWPILPVLDWELLKTSLAMPAETLAKRKAQIALISTRFPQLAQLPLDRNGYNTEPLQPSQTREMLAPLFELQSKWRKLQQKLGYERRYYYRIYNINNDGWQAVRRQAEPCRESIQHLFNPEVLDQIVPHSDIIIHGKLDEITGVSGLKTLIGLSLWSQEYL